MKKKPETTVHRDKKQHQKNPHCLSLSNKAVLKCHYQISSIASLLSVLDT